MSKAFVGIDVAKEYSTAQGIDSNEKKIFYLRFAMDLPVKSLVFSLSVRR